MLGAGARPNPFPPSADAADHDPRRLLAVSQNLGEASAPHPLPLLEDGARDVADIHRAEAILASRREAGIQRPIMANPSFPSFALLR